MYNVDEICNWKNGQRRKYRITLALSCMYTHRYIDLTKNTFIALLRIYYMISTHV